MTCKHLQFIKMFISLDFFWWNKRIRLFKYLFGMTPCHLAIICPNLSQFVCNICTWLDGGLNSTPNFRFVGASRKDSWIPDSQAMEFHTAGGHFWGVLRCLGGVRRIFNCSAKKDHNIKIQTSNFIFPTNQTCNSKPQKVSRLAILAESVLHVFPLLDCLAKGAHFVTSSSDTLGWASRHVAAKWGPKRV